MKKQHLIIVLLCAGMLLLKSNNMNAQENQKLKKQTYKAYLTNSLSVWKTIESNISKKQQANPENVDLLLDLVKVRYGLLNCCLGKRNEEEFERYIDQAKENVETLLQINPEHAETHALKAGLLSLEMGFNPRKGMFLGPESGQHIEKAIAYDQTEPTGWMQKGGSKLHTPAMFGGSVEESITCYKEAVRLFEKDSAIWKNNWLYINTLAWLGMAYKENENYEKALETYNKALAIEPEFGWVEHNLKKTLEKEMKD